MRYDSFKASLAGIGLLCLALGAFFPAVMRRPALCGSAPALREECALFSVPAGASSRTPHGLDIASYAGPVRLATWEQLKQDGLKFAVVSGWQGRGRNRYARRQLAGARQAGLKTAAYCLLNFDRQDQSGAWQVRQALAAIGGEPVSFLALDIETVFFPRRLSAAQALKRIREAVAATRRAGIAPVLYTGRHAWQVITRDCADADLARLPLWDARYAPWLNEETDNLASDADGPWRPYGGWRRRLGKQYGCEKSQTGECLRLQYDLNADPDVFDPTAWKPARAGCAPAPGPAIPAARAHPRLLARLTGKRALCRAKLRN